jgi:hypothetical protein
MRSISDIFQELLSHPDYLGGVVWCKDDVIAEMEALEDDGCVFSMSVDDIWERLDIGGWEDCATTDGYGAISMEMRMMKAYERESE